MANLLKKSKEALNKYIRIIRFIQSFPNFKNGMCLQIYENFYDPAHIMKSRSDARPVYLQKNETTTGHFLICYLAVLLTRLLHFKILGNAFCTEEILDFMKGFTTAKLSVNAYINLTKNKPFINEMTRITGLPLTPYFLTDVQKMLKRMFRSSYSAIFAG